MSEEIAAEFLRYFKGFEKMEMGLRQHAGEPLPRPLEGRRIIGPGQFLYPV